MPSRRRKQGPQPDQTQPSKRRHEDECSDHKLPALSPSRASGMLAEPFALPGLGSGHAPPDRRLLRAGIGWGRTERPSVRARTGCDVAGPRRVISGATHLARAGASSPHQPL
jgi:hypothetical protein